MVVDPIWLQTQPTSNVRADPIWEVISDLFLGHLFLFHQGKRTLLVRRDEFVDERARNAKVAAAIVR